MEILEKKTVREDILDYLKKHGEVSNPWDITKVTHRHIQSIRRELRILAKLNLITVELEEKTNRYISIKLNSERVKPVGPSSLLIRDGERLTVDRVRTNPNLTVKEILEITEEDIFIEKGLKARQAIFNFFRRITSVFK